MNQETITYEGQVKIKYLIHGKEVEYKKHNEGLNSLFQYLCKALSGDISDLANKRPTYLDVKCIFTNSETGEEESVSCLYNALSLSEPIYKFDTELNSWITRFSVVLSFSMINYEIVNMHPNGAFYLYILSKDHTTEFARLLLEEDQLELTDIIPGTQALVEWTMLLKNAGQEEA